MLVGMYYTSLYVQSKYVYLKSIFSFKMKPTEELEKTNHSLAFQQSLLIFRVA